MIFVLASCGVLPETTLTVVNDGERKTPDFSVVACRQQIWAGQLEPGASASTVFTPQGDCSFDVRLSHPDGTPAVTPNLGYTTPNDGQKHSIHVDGTRARHTLVGMPLPPLVNRVQQVLDHPQIAMYLHPEVALNLPLRVQVPEILREEAANAMVGGQVVQVVKAEKFPRVRLLRRAGSQFDLKLQIPDEGVEGSLRLQESEGAWTVQDVVVTER